MSTIPDNGNNLPSFYTFPLMFQDVSTIFIYRHKILPANNSQKNKTLSNNLLVVPFT